MKTLDEVIKEQERCNTYPNCHFCYLHSGSICSWIRDALHYLKAYRENQIAYEDGNRKAEEARERYIEAVKNCELAENKYKRLYEETSQNLVNTSQNEPLTWDELQTMEGKPVWVEWISGCWKGSSKWVLINGIDDLMIMFTAIDVAMESYGGHLREISLGKTWQAFRKEREG